MAQLQGIASTEICDGVLLPRRTQGRIKPKSIVTQATIQWVIATVAIGHIGKMITGTLDISRAG